MKNLKNFSIAIFALLLLITGQTTVGAQRAQMSGDQVQSVSDISSETTLAESFVHESHEVSACSRATSAPAAKADSTQRARSAKGSGMVWVNTDSGVYHKPGTRWYGKTKHGKYMTEADAVKAGYRPASKH
jgi:hypothetical protein